jgi:hypothetical protein
VAEWGALLRRCPGSPDRGFKSLPLRHIMASALVLATAFTVVLVAMPSMAWASDCTQHHTAKPNDSWTRIAARFGLSLRSTLDLNGATTRTPIFIGDKVCISTRPVISMPTERYSRKQSAAIIREVWPDELEETALYVARRESKLTHTAVGGRNDCCFGLFQMYWSVHRGWLAEMGVTEASQLLDPRVNAEAALVLYRRNGNSWRPWWTSSWRL